jgi:DUF4097 and DUF4098 domain-containing protein YvlB
MKSPHLITKFFIASILWTVGFFSLALFAGIKAYKSDPDILTKLENKYNVRIDQNGIHGEFESFKNTDWKKSVANWKFLVPKQKLTIKTFSGDIQVIQSKDSEVHISAKGLLNENKSKKLLETEISDDELVVSEIKNATNNLLIQIEIPSGYNQNIAITSFAGDISIVDLNLSQLDLATVSGEIAINKMKIKILDTKTVSGEIRASDSEISEFVGKSVSGDFNISNKIETETSVKTVSGDVHLNLTPSESYKFSLKSVSGDIENTKSNNKSGTKNIEISTTSGDIEIL